MEQLKRSAKASAATTLDRTPWDCIRICAICHICTLASSSLSMVECQIFLARDRAEGPGASPVGRCSATTSEARTQVEPRASRLAFLGAISWLEVESSAGLFRGGALCGAPLLERLLRRLLSELLGFLRALHLHPPLVAGSDRARRRDAKPRQGDNSVLEDRRRPRKANAHTEYRTALGRMTCRGHHRDRVRDRRNPRRHPHPTCFAALVSLSSTRSTNGHPG
jgi:hypothetical protein